MRTLIVVAAVLLLAATAQAFTAEQAERGKEIFAKQCAGCHGAQGQGGRVPAQFGKMAGWNAPPVAGPGALPEQPPADRKLRKTPLHTAADVHGFISKNMPAQAPGTLSEQDYIDLVAFDLHANGMKPDNMALTRENAAQVMLHPKK